MRFFSKILFLFLFFFTVSATTKAQEGINLVPNPSFEEYLDCPEGFPDLDDKCKDWMTFRITPDYFHNCSPTTGWHTWHGYKESHTGMAHAGFSTYHTGLPNIANEHIGTQLISPLLVGEKYYVSFFVSAAYQPISLNVATNKIGALFTTYSYNQEDPFSSNFPTPNNYAHIYTDNIVTDTINWIKISGSFIADSTYQYIVIGNFFEDSYLDTLNFQNIWGPFTSYYYLDDVCVTTDSLYNEMWEGVVSVQQNVPNLEILCYPNPTSNFLNIESYELITSIELVNVLGQSILYMESFTESFLTVSVDQYSKGYYILKINTLNNSTAFKIFIN